MKGVDKNHRHGEAPTEKVKAANVFPVDWVVYEQVSIGVVSARFAQDALAEAGTKFRFQLKRELGPLSVLPKAALEIGPQEIPKAPSIDNCPKTKVQKCLIVSYLPKKI